MNDVASTISRQGVAMARELANATYPAVAEASLVVKRAVEASRDSVTSGGRLRNVGRKGAKLNVRYDILRSSHVISLIRATGPWQIIERDTKAHEIAPRKRGGFKALNTPEGPRARVLNHPGTRGKAPFAKGIRAGVPPANVILARQLETAVLRGFKA